MITGFFCTIVIAACSGAPAHQTLVQPGTRFVPQCGPVFEVTRNGRAVAAYVDDTLNGNERRVQACAKRALHGATVYAGEFWHNYGFPHGLVEWYPVADHRSRVGKPPPPGSAGYILQAFSWGDNLSDGETAGWHRCTNADSTASCSRKYQRPNSAQLRLMWCRALARKPHVVLWYYAGGEPLGGLLHIMRHPC